MQHVCVCAFAQAFLSARLFENPLHAATPTPHCCHRRVSLADAEAWVSRQEHGNQAVHVSVHEKHQPVNPEED